MSRRRGAAAAAASRGVLFTKGGVQYRIGGAAPPLRQTCPPDCFAALLLTLGWPRADTALLKSNEALPYVAAIMGIVFDKKGLLHVKCGWYFRPEDLNGGRQGWHGESELFKSELTGERRAKFSFLPFWLVFTYRPAGWVLMDASGCRGADNNPIESIMARVEVVDLETYKDKASTKKPGQFMYHRFSYDTKSRLPKDSEVSSAARFCTCQQPENPDRLMVCCESCSTWFHGGAHAKQADLTFSASWFSRWFA